MLHVFKNFLREETKLYIYNKRFLNRHKYLNPPRIKNYAFYEKDSSNYHHSKSRPQVEILSYKGGNPYKKGG